jgi:tetratricopeptide (TPR) repeat protein
MSRWTYWCALFALAIFPCLEAAESQKKEDDSVESLILGLGADSFQERERATRLLWENGEKGLKALEQASRSDDPETAMRAMRVLEKVELRIYPDTDPEILEQIESYRKAPENQKPNHLNALRQKKAFFQMLKLFSTEPNADTKANMTPMMRGVAIMSAREAILADDFAEALKLLEMSAKEPTDVVALACVYRSMGKLKDPRNQPPAPSGVSKQDWQLAVLRVKGELKAAMALAAETKQTLLHAGLSAINGDPLPWLRANADDALHEYAKIAERRWNGELLKANDYAALVEVMQDFDSENQMKAKASLVALGQLEEAEKNQAKVQPLAAFGYFLTQERIDEALMAVGLDPNVPNYKKWVEERFRKIELGNDHRDTSTPQDELCALANFLESRALREELDQAFSGSLRDLEKKDQAAFLDVVRELFSAIGAPLFALDFGAKWAGEDQNRWADISAAVFGAEDQAEQWMEWVGGLEPGLGQKETMRLLMALFGLGHDEDALAEKWLKRAWIAIEGTAPKKQEAHLQKMINLAVTRQDVTAALKARDLLSKPVRETMIWPGIEHYFTAAGRWKDAVELLEKSGSETSSSPERHALLAVMLRRAGAHERAAHHDDLAERLALGHSPSCSLIGDYYTYGGDLKRAAKWYREAASLADMSNEFFFNGMEKFAQSSFESEMWGIAASCYELLVHHSVTDRYVNHEIDFSNKTRMKADLAKACAIFPKNRQTALRLLGQIHQNFSTDGLLADDFFPALKKLGLESELAKYFEISWAKIAASIQRYPGADNPRNTAAWLAGRAGMRQNEAENYLQVALARNPRQPAYLDTMAELHFAKGDREAALKYSREAIRFYPQIFSPYDLMIRRQHERFLHAPIPR